MSHACLSKATDPSDDGSVDPLLAEVLGDDLQVLARLGSARVFVPVVAVVTDDDQVHASAAGDRDAEMATVMLTGHDGRRGLVAFTSLAVMQGWDARSRPVAVSGVDVAQVALSDGASALLLDIGAESFSVVETDDLGHLAQGHQLVRTAGGTAWVG